MKIIRDLSKLDIDSSIVSLGKFDGVHKGHQALISKMMEHKKNRSTIIFTFDIPKDSPFYKPEQANIFSEKEKEKKFESLGIDYYILYPFTKKAMDMEAEDFISEILINKLNATEVVVGDDFRFGKDRRGDVEMLEAFAEIFDFTVTVIKRIEFDGEPISSTRIREALKKGEEDLAKNML